MQTKTGHHPIYRYYFSHRPPGDRGKLLGAFHASEIPYVFGNFTWPFPYDDADKKLSDAVMSYWTNFAKTGDPNAGTLTNWPGYISEKDNVLEFGDPIHVSTHVNQRGLDFYDAYHQSLAASHLGAGSAR
jgi:para-nitrobenzyl esterase